MAAQVGEGFTNINILEVYLQNGGSGSSGLVKEVTFYVMHNVRPQPILKILCRYMEWLAEDPSPREEASDKLMAPIVPELADLIVEKVLITHLPCPFSHRTHTKK